MKYFDIKKNIDPLIVFSLKDIYLVDPGFRQATLYDWEKTNRVQKLKNASYIFSDFQPRNLDLYLISNLLYEPSYISTELALNHYGVIPEVVVRITAVTTNKTRVFPTEFAHFSYQKIKPELFFGYSLVEVRNHGVQIASLEKAILDFLYLNPKVTHADDFSELRWNKHILTDELDWKKLTAYLAIFANKALAKRVNSLKIYLGKKEK